MAAQISVSSAETTTVVLKDGSEIAKPAFDTIMRIIQTIEHSSYFAFCDLVKKCRDPNFTFEHNPSGGSKKRLQRHVLIDQHGEVYDLVKTVVLNATLANSSSFQLVDPKQWA